MVTIVKRGKRDTYTRVRVRTCVGGGGGDTRRRGYAAVQPASAGRRDADGGGQGLARPPTPARDARGGPERTQDIGGEGRRCEGARIVRPGVTAPHIYAMRGATIAGQTDAAARAATPFIYPCPLRRLHRCDGAARIPFWVGLRGCAEGNCRIAAATNR